MMRNEMIRTMKTYNLDPTSETRLVQSVRLLWEKSQSRCREAYQQLFGVKPNTFNHSNQELIFMQYAINGLCNDPYKDRSYIIDESVNKALSITRDNNWMLVTSEDDTMANNNNSSQPQSGTKVKRGGRREIVEQLYRDLIVNGTEPTSRKEMIDIFVEQANMTAAGASTYFANLKKEFGDPKQLIVSGRKVKAA